MRQTVSASEDATSRSNATSDEVLGTLRLLASSPSPTQKRKMKKKAKKAAEEAAKAAANPTAVLGSSSKTMLPLTSLAEMRVEFGWVGEDWGRDCESICSTVRPRRLLILLLSPYSTKF
jgi:hypothetical protein